MDWQKFMNRDAETSPSYAAADSGAVSSARPRDEMLPFLNNFHDIFTTIGVLILGGGLVVGLVQVMSGLDMAEGSVSWQLSAIGLTAGVAAILFLISTVLVGKQRRILPGIALNIGFVASVATALFWLWILYLSEWSGISEASMESAFDSNTQEFGRDLVNGAWSALPLQAKITPIILVLSGLIPSIFYYLSFRLPFAGGLTGVGLVMLAGTGILFADPFIFGTYLPALNLAMGGTLLLAGILFDARDPSRETRLSGTAFWLHFFAAPWILNAALNVSQFGWTLEEADFVGERSVFSRVADGGTDTAAIALGIIAGFALISLLINRRALIVSGLITAGISIGVLINEIGWGAGAVTAVTLLTLGGIVVLLGAAWNPVRSILLAPFPSSGPLARIFPPANGEEG